MKEITANLRLNIGYAGKHEDTVTLEFEDSATPEEIEKAFEEYWQEWIWLHIDGGWEII